MHAFSVRFTLASLGVGILSLGLAAVSGVQAVELADHAPEVYEVRPGDTLWSIAGRFLRDPWLWPEVWRANDEVDNPNLLYPGERLRLARVDGKPRVMRDAPGVATGEMRVVKLSPRVRVSALEAPVPTIPVASIAPFLTESRVADSDDIKRVPYVVGFPDDRTIAGTHDAVFVRSIETAGVSDFEILRPGDALRDPENNRILGYQATFIANAVLERVGDPAILRVTRSEREVAIGDRVIPASRGTCLENVMPRAAPKDERGRILAVMNGVSQIGQYDIVILNRGRREGIESGHVFEVFNGGDEARDEVRDGTADWSWRNESPLTSEFWLGHEWSFDGWIRDAPDPNTPLPLHADIRRDRATYIRPLQRAGILMVFRTFDRLSFALVLSAQRAMRVGDPVAAPPRSDGSAPMDRASP